MNSKPGKRSETNHGFEDPRRQESSISQPIFCANRYRLFRNVIQGIRNQLISKKR
jgi:hypothetical protein